MMKKHFMDNVRIDPSSGCWVWKGAMDPAGYGRAGKKFAHRYSYDLLVGPIPDGHFVCHTCDVRACVNPNHLFTGTHRDNMRDMRTKGRSYRPCRL